MAHDNIAEAAPGSSARSPYSPLNTVEHNEAATSRRLKSAIRLLLIFCSVYFVAAMIATPEFKAVANITIFGIPLAFYTGMLVFVVGIVVTRMCLSQDQKS